MTSHLHDGARRRTECSGTAGPSAAGRVHFVALLLATVSLVLGTIGLVAAAATYDGREQRAAARAPLSVTAGSPGAGALWYHTFDTVGGRQHSVVFIEPLSPGSPLPPGLSRWPEPGEAVLSPALASADPTAVTRYGRTIGSIQEDGLMSPDERLAYVRPVRDVLDPSRMERISGYGAKHPYPLGDVLSDQPLRSFIRLTAATVLLPAGVLLLVARRMRPRSHGPDAGSTMLAGLRRAATPVTVGVAAGIGAGGLLMIRDLRLPITHYTLLASDLRSWWPCLLSVPLIGGLLALAASAFPSPRGTKSLRCRSAGPARWCSGLCLAFLLFASYGPTFAPDPDTRVLINVIGAVGTLAALPLALTRAVGAAGRSLSSLGHRIGSSRITTAGRRAAAHPLPIALPTAGIAIAIVLLSHVQFLASTSALVTEARQTQAEVGNSILVAEYRNGDPRTRAFVGALPTSTHVLVLEPTPQMNGGLLRGPCEALTELGLPCSPEALPVPTGPVDRRVEALGNWYTAGVQNLTFTSAQALDSPEPGKLVLVADGRSELDVPAVKHVANRSLGMAPSISAVGDSWLSGASVAGERSRWLTLFGWTGIAVWATAMTLTAVAGLQKTEHLPRSAATPHRQRLLSRRVSAAALIPATAGSLLGPTLQLWLATPLLPLADHVSLGRSSPWQYGIAATGTSLVIVLFMWAARAGGHPEGP
ncbi:hypothetical protein ABZZ20_24055 [Streptomyces sp. NPDC006430]|uniref:hypothetical protein n=1 Tax=Streptomyces sp. NPDC006430 TaxID=3154299 RepID=UPI0033B613CC